MIVKMLQKIIQESSERDDQVITCCVCVSYVITVDYISCNLINKLSKAQ